MAGETPIAASLDHPYEVVVEVIPAASHHLLARQRYHLPRPSPTKHPPSCPQAQTDASIDQLLTHHTNTQIVVEKLTKNVLPSHLHEIFSPYGPIADLDLPLNRAFNTNRGTAYILYEKTADAESAISSMHEAQLDGAVISVSIVLPRRRWSRSPPPARRQFGRGGGGAPPLPAVAAAAGGGGRDDGYGRGPPPGPPTHRYRSPPPRTDRGPPPPARGYGGDGRSNTYRPRTYSRSRSPPPRRGRSYSDSLSRSPPPRRRSPPRGGGGGYRDRSPPPRGGGGGGRRRSPSYSSYSSYSRSRSRSRRR
ncbi:hypothetical protein LTS18_009726 [Coniosporium uncinatum]|uniref:Uncharacterized protein n=1 Tax=Coniosporium uncinatum TaxID=93489 RepID=A0ACC3D0B6_9PEZI|nr:hypothetical protein LTS18_009726 [Coniosporium uncinatum]